MYQNNKYSQEEYEESKDDETPIKDGDLDFDLDGGLENGVKKPLLKMPKNARKRRPTL